MVAVAIEGLDKRFGTTSVLKQISLTVEDGEFAVLVGPSGCGKSTLLRLIAGLEQPSAGTIVFGDRDVTQLPPRDRDIAMVFQTYALYPHLTVKDNLAFGLKLRKTPQRAIDKRVAEVSAMLGLDSLLARMPRELSGGQRQRVAMGRAIARRPSLFLFDEPLSNLDAALRAQVRVDIQQLHHQLGTTSIYVTHDQVEAMTLADKMFVLNGGCVEQSGPPLTVYDRPATRFVAGFLGSPSTNFLEGKLALGDGGAAVVLGDGDGADRLALKTRPKGVKDGAAVVVGIRPHDMVQADDGAMRMTLKLVEELGGETYAYGRVLDQPVVARLNQRLLDVRPGSQLRMTAAADRIHLFDPDSGATLR